MALVVVAGLAWLLQPASSRARSSHPLVLAAAGALLAVWAGTSLVSLLAVLTVAVLLRSGPVEDAVVRGARLAWIPVGLWAVAEVLLPLGRVRVDVDEADFLALVEEHLATAVDRGVAGGVPVGGLYGGLGHLFAAAHRTLSWFSGSDPDPVVVTQSLQLAFIALIVLSLFLINRPLLPIMILLAVASVPARSLSTDGPGMIFINQSGARYLGLAVVVAAIAWSARGRPRRGAVRIAGLSIAIVSGPEIGLVAVAGSLVASVFVAHARGEERPKALRSAGLALLAAGAIASPIIAFVPGLGSTWMRSASIVVAFGGGFGGYVDSLTPLSASMIPIVGVLLLIALGRAEDDPESSSLIAALATMGLLLTSKFANRMIEWEMWSVALLVVLAVAEVLRPVRGGARRPRARGAASVAVVVALLITGGPGLDPSQWIDRMVDPGGGCDEDLVPLDQYCLNQDLAEEVTGALDALAAAVPDHDSTLVLGMIPTTALRRGFNALPVRASFAGEVIRAEDPDAFASEISVAGVDRIVVLRRDSALAVSREQWIDLQEEIREAAGFDTLVWRDAFWNYYRIGASGSGSPGDVTDGTIP